MKQETYLKEFIRYAASNVLGMIGISCYILADTFFISKGVGADGLTALNLAIPVYSLIHGCGLMFGVGGAAKFSMLKGQQQYGECNKIFTSTLYASIILSVIFMLTGIFLSGTITDLLGADEAVFDMTKTYLGVILLFAPAFMLNDSLNCFVRNDGNPGLSMIAMLIGSFSNIVFDYILVFPLKMGILGAVLATAISPIISVVILSGYLRKRKQFSLKKTRLYPKLLEKIVSLGLPSLITEVASGVVIMVFNIIILGIQGNIGVAAYGVIANLSLVVVSIHTGVAQGMQPLVSRSYGYGDKRSAKKILRYAMITMLCISVIVYAGIFLFADPITSVFNGENNKQLQEIAVKGLKIYFLAVPFVGFNIIMSMFFISTEKALPAQLISILRGMILIIPAAFILSFFAGLVGVWMTLCVVECTVAILGIGLYVRIGK